MRPTAASNVFFQHASRTLRHHIQKRCFTVLAFESSADDSCVAIVNSNRQILSNVVIKQHVDHEIYGGIHPAVAILSHQKNMPGAVRRAFEEAGLSVSDIDGVAFTRGPGIGGCLSVGSNAAKNLAAALGKPLVGVHHMQAHALTPLLTSPSPPTFPFLTILISGGHTMIVLASSLTDFRILATTVDESIGNAFDKVSRFLAISWSHSSDKPIGPGAALERFALSYPDTDSSNLITPSFPVPMRSQLAFSFAGLVSSVQRHLSLIPPQELTNERKAAIARSFQAAAAGQIEEKLKLALRWCEREGIKVTTVVASGGVASNMYLRERLELCTQGLETALPVVFPPLALCTDNAAMIAWAAMHRFLENSHDDYTIDLRPKWSMESLINA